MVFFKGRKAPAVPLFLTKKNKSERMNRMKKNPTLWSSVSVLIVAILAITTFIRGQAQVWLYGVAFAVWTVWAAVKFLVPYVQQKRIQYEARSIRKKYEAKKPKLNIPDASDPVGVVLLRHVNFRISSYLKSSYPDATWEWREEFPEKIVLGGSTGRIQVYGIPDFNYADVSFNQQAEINCNLLKIVPMAELQNSSEQSAPKPQQQRPADPQIWYETQGRKVLENLIADLNSRGHNSLTIKENGEILIQQAEKEVKQAALESVPEKTYWQRLVSVFQREGLAAKFTDNGMVLSW